MFSKFDTSNIWKKAIDAHGKRNYELRITDYFRKVQTNHNVTHNVTKSYASEKARTTLKRGIKKYRLQLSYIIFYSQISSRWMLLESLPLFNNNISLFNS